MIGTLTQKLALVVICVLVDNMIILAEKPHWTICENDVFVAGEGYGMYRIPVIVTTNKGTLLAFIEGRDNISDHAQNDIVLKRSSDKGRNWGELITVAEAGNNCLNNPQAVVLPETGRIICFYTFNPEGYHTRAIGDSIKVLKSGVSGPDVGLCFMTVSDDDGLTWSAPLDITAQVKRPQKIIGIASGPGVGIVLRNEPHKGRIIMPFNESWYEADGKRISRVYSVYSDDNGKSWKYGNPAPYDHEKPAG